MSSKKKVRTGKIVTQGRLSRWQREQRWRRIAIITGSVIVAIVLALFGYGYYDSAIQPYHQTILKVNDTTFDADHYIEMLRLNGISNVDDSSQKQYIAQYSLQSIKRNEMLRQLAPDLGLKVTGEEVDKEIQKQLSPSSEGEEDLGVTQQSMSYEEYVEKLKEIGVSEEFYREQVSVNLLQNKMKEHIGNKKVPGKVTQAHVKGIMVEDEEILNKAQEKLGIGGSFSALAKEFSQHSSSEDGGDLGWMPREIMITQYPERLANTAFNLTLGKVSDPIEIETQTETGENSNDSENTTNKKYWFIKVLEREERPLEDSDRQTLQDQAFSEWFSKQQNQFNIEEHLSPDLQEWAIEKAIG